MYYFIRGIGQWNPLCYILFLAAQNKLSFIEFFRYFNPKRRRKPVFKMPKIRPVGNDIFGRLWWCSYIEGERYLLIGWTLPRVSPCKVNATRRQWPKGCLYLTRQSPGPIKMRQRKQGMRATNCMTWFHLSLASFHQWPQNFNCQPAGWLFRSLLSQRNVCMEFFIFSRSTKGSI